MTDGSLFNLDAIETSPGQDLPPTEAEADSSSPALSGATPAARDASAPKSLYRKYRPQSFDSDDLFGQEHIVNTLRNAIALDRIAHAYLFCGPRGTGKTTSARLLAKAVNCMDPDPRKRPCNQCEACVAINTGATTDVIEIDAASNRGIDDIRDLRERVKYAPSQLTTKFYIIDEAHQITGAAANAFLKTLEEPPAHTKFILATTDPEELLQTIVSRCQRFDFRRISLDAMTACLTKVAAAENIDIDSEAKIAIARHATGSMRDALGLLDQVAVYRERVEDDNTKVTVDLVRNVLGVSKNERVEEIATALADKDAGAGLRAVGQAVEAGDDIRQLARQLLAYLRELLLERAGGASELDANGKALAQRFEIGEIADLTRLMGDIDFKVKHATISQLPLEVAIVEGALRDQRVQRVATTQPPPPMQAMQAERPHSAPPAPAQQERPASPRPSWKDKVRGGPGSDASAPPEPQSPPRQQPQPQRPSSPPPGQGSRPAASVPTSAPSASPAPAVIASNGGVLELESLVDGWARIKADVKAVNRRIEALLQQIDPVAINGTTVTLVTPYEFHRNRVNTDEVRQVIEEVILHQFGEKISILCMTRAEMSSMAPTAAPSQPAASQTAPPPVAQAHAPTRESASPRNNAVEDPAPVETTDPPMIVEAERQIEAARNIFDAEIEDPGKP
jgi:DNA polymerase-3 subunit gamma/tau